MKILNSHLYSLLVVVCSLIFSAACIRFHHEPTRAELGTHLVSIRPQCDVPSTTSHRRFEKDGSSDITHYEFTCGDTTVLIHDNTLNVNGKSYGTLSAGDQIAIDFGKIRVNSEVRTEVR
jgi:hypothetical protein